MSTEIFNIVASQRTQYGVDGSITPLASQFYLAAENTTDVDPNNDFTNDGPKF